MAAEGNHSVFTISDNVPWALHDGQPPKPVSFACAHCKAVFLVNTALKKIRATCPRCRKTSVVKEKHVRNEAVANFIMGLIALSVGLGVTVLIGTVANGSGGVIEHVFDGAIILGVCYIIGAAVYACCNKTSHPVSNTPHQDLP